MDVCNLDRAHEPQYPSPWRRTSNAIDSCRPLSGSVHELKTDPALYDEVAAGTKTFEIRKDDRGFQVGDVLFLRRTLHDGIDMRAGAPLVYTGESIKVAVVGIMRGPVYGLVDGWVIMSIRSMTSVR